MKENESLTASITLQNNLPPWMFFFDFMVTFTLDGMEWCNLLRGEKITTFLKQGKYLIQARIDYTSNTQPIFIEVEAGKNTLISLEAMNLPLFMRIVYFFIYPKYHGQLILKNVRPNSVLSVLERKSQWKEKLAPHSSATSAASE